LGVFVGLVEHRTLAVTDKSLPHQFSLTELTGGSFLENGATYQYTIFYCGELPDDCETSTVKSVERTFVLNDSSLPTTSSCEIKVTRPTFNGSLYDQDDFVHFQTCSEGLHQLKMRRVDTDENKIIDLGNLQFGDHAISSEDIKNRIDSASNFLLQNEQYNIWVLACIGGTRNAPNCDNTTSGNQISVPFTWKSSNPTPTPITVNSCVTNGSTLYDPQPRKLGREMCSDGFIKEPYSGTYAPSLVDIKSEFDRRRLLYLGNEDQKVHREVLNQLYLLAMRIKQIANPNCQSLYVVKGYVSYADQVALYTQNRATNERPGYSVHQSGIALDLRCAVITSAGNVSVNDIPVANIINATSFGFDRPVSTIPHHYIYFW
jgi:hypothetical protein